MQLQEKHRPKTLGDIRGQALAVEVLKDFAAKPYPQTFLFSGQSGTGKTSAALALARALGCDMDQRPEEFGGVHQIASGEQTGEAVREAMRQLRYCPLSGSGWKVLIVNEADQMSSSAAIVWLDALEHLPPQSVIVFTTNDPDKLSKRFRGRCVPVEFASDADTIRQAAEDYCAAVWEAETGRPASKALIGRVVFKTMTGTELSFRDAIQAVGLEIIRQRTRPEPVVVKMPEPEPAKPTAYVIKDRRNLAWAKVAV